MSITRASVTMCTRRCRSDAALLLHRLVKVASASPLHRSISSRRWRSMPCADYVDFQCLTIISSLETLELTLGGCIYRRIVGSGGIEEIWEARAQGCLVPSVVGLSSSNLLKWNYSCAQ